MISETESQLMGLLGNALLPIIDGVLVKGLSNKVAPPRGEYTLMTPITSERMATNAYSNDAASETHETLYTYSVQIDCYGNNSGNRANIINILFRSDYFNERGIVPLWSSNPRQLMFTDGSSQMIERWTQDVNVSYNPSVTLTIDTANVLDVNNITA